jgi:hypothetical protein
MNPTSLELSSTTDYRGTDNRSYARSANDIHLPTLNEEESTDVKLSPPATTTSSSSFPIIYEEPTPTINMMTSTNSIGQPPSASSASFTHQSGRKSSALGLNERQLSILDPMSDRVSTILVWQNLTVQARQSKRKEFFKRIKSYKDFVPTRKCLLSNTSGAITGGLWAVMGKFSFSIYIIHILNIIITHRSIGFW